MAARAQSGERYVKLIMVTGNNNNKYYEMTYDGVSANFDVRYGRVESTAATGSYPISQWQSKYNEKVRKGYKDVTAYVTNDVVNDGASNGVKDLVKIKEAKVEEFMTLMRKYNEGLVAKTYSVKATSVTQAQVDDAQKTIDKLLALNQKARNFQSKANDLLTELYTIIPRRMGNTRDHLLPNISFDLTMQEEQVNLDAMAGQVAMNKPKKVSKKTTKETKTLLDALGITMKQTKNHPEIEYLLKQVGRNKVAAVFEVNKPEEDTIFNGHVSKAKNKATRHLIHGTRCSSVIPILEIGLKIRPAGNFQFSGKVYGDGNYFSEVVSKSLNYTGYDDDKILLVYEVHTGNPYVYQGWYNGNSFPLNYAELSKRGFDSTYVKAGNGLLNSEIIAYTEKQNRIKYIIWLKD